MKTLLVLIVSMMLLDMIAGTLHESGVRSCIKGLKTISKEQLI